MRRGAPTKRLLKRHSPARGRGGRDVFQFRQLVGKFVMDQGLYGPVFMGSHNEMVGQRSGFVGLGGHVRGQSGGGKGQAFKAISAVL